MHRGLLFIAKTIIASGLIALEPVQLIIDLNGKIVERTLPLSDFRGGDVVKVTWVARTY